MKPFIFTVTLALATIFGIGAQAPSGTPVARWGALRVEGARLVSDSGEPVVLRGVSLYDTTSYGEYANPDSLAWLRDDWKANLFRSAMYTAYNGRFIGTAAYPAMWRSIDAAIATGMYILVDWHILSDGNPLVHKNEAWAFFAETARRYAGVPNLIYEICNEPNGTGVSWEGAIKPYALEIIPAIREADPRALIVVGTPEWSSRPEIAAADPLPFHNLLYALHFYAGSHDSSYIDRIDQAMALGQGVFVTEWGTTTAQVTGLPQVRRTLFFMDALAERGISWANWSLGTKLEATSLLKPLASPRGSWAPGDLTDSGHLVRSILRGDREVVAFADNFDSGNFRGGAWVREGTGLDTVVTRSGTGSLRFEGKATMDKTLLAEGVSSWTWSFEARGEGWRRGDRFLVQWSPDGQVWHTLAEVALPQAWTRIQGHLPPEAEGRATIVFRLASAFVSRNARFWVDDVEIRGIRNP